MSLTKSSSTEWSFIAGLSSASFWRQALIGDTNLEFDVVNLVFQARQETFTDKDKVLMKVLYSCPVLQRSICTLGGVVDWIMEHRDLTEDEVVTLMLEYGDTL